MKIVTLRYDSDLEDPCNEDGWKVYSFSHRHRSYRNPADFFPNGKAGIGLRRKLAVGTAFILSYFEHGGCVWSLRGTGPRCQWDSVDVAGVLVWEGKVADLGPKTYEDRAKDASAFLRVYTAWCNGEGYSYSVDNVKQLPCGHTETESVDSCGGFYGTDLDFMAEQVREAVGGDKQVQIRGEAKDLADFHDFGQGDGEDDGEDTAAPTDPAREDFHSDDGR